ncbi:ribonuclease H1-like isoform X1 [Homarus americanus]|uniref:ribonuclease H1-like isoform X1 n=1 Tax=Homarus americanus TaxID=6706 RepID=UPI001C49702D|nr:ribonuclease H1-like isoform X1 [Homarus americanus]
MRGWRSLASLSRVLSTIQILHVRKMPFYAVARGHKPGIYESWPECQKQINGFHCARYKKFSTKDEAEEFVQENAASNPVVDRREKPATERENKGSEKEKASEPSRQLDPALNEMKNKMKRLQKELSVLRSEFDDYVATTCGVHPKFSRKNSSLKPSFAADKRKRDDSSDSDEDSNGPSVVKKLNTGDSGGSDKTKFSTDSDGFLIVYTDGACEFNGRNGAKAGVGVYFGKDHPLNVSEPVKGRATNNTAEIQAASFALELAKASGFSKVSIHTDSQFMINCMTSWLKNWKKKNWVKSDGEPVKNKEDLIALDAASEDLAVKWVHVKGHAGHEGNEIADKLARQGAKLYKADPDA